MTFTIKVTYKDGDSFHTYTSHETLDYNWTDEQVVIKNMIAIKEHYEAFRAANDSFYRDEYKEDFKTKWWYKKNEYERDDDVPYGLNLMKDDGTLFYYHCPWCGYFEHLEEIEMGIKNFKIEIN